MNLKWLGGERGRFPAGRIDVPLLALFLTSAAAATFAEERMSVATRGLRSERFHGALVRLADGRLLNWWSSGKKGAQQARGRYSADEGVSWTPE